MTHCSLFLFLLAAWFAAIPVRSMPAFLLPRHDGQNATYTPTLHQNALDAQKLNAEFANLTANDTCQAGAIACVNKQFALCTAGKWALTPCSAGMTCVVVPLVQTKGTTITCDREEDVLLRFEAAGLNGSSNECEDDHTPPPDDDCNDDHTPPHPDDCEDGNVTTSAHTHGTATTTTTSAPVVKTTANGLEGTTTSPKPSGTSVVSALDCNMTTQGSPSSSSPPTSSSQPPILVLGFGRTTPGSPSSSSSLPASSQPAVVVVGYGRTTPVPSPSSSSYNGYRRQLSPLVLPTIPTTVSDSSSTTTSGSDLPSQTSPIPEPSTSILSGSQTVTVTIVSTVTLTTQCGTGTNFPSGTTSNPTLSASTNLSLPTLPPSITPSGSSPPSSSPPSSSPPPPPPSSGPNATPSPRPTPPLIPTTTSTSSSSRGGFSFSSMSMPTPAPTTGTEGLSTSINLSETI